MVSTDYQSTPTNLGAADIMARSCQGNCLYIAFATSAFIKNFDQTNDTASSSFSFGACIVASADILQMSCPVIISSCSECELCVWLEHLCRCTKPETDLSLSVFHNKCLLANALA